MSPSYYAPGAIRLFASFQQTSPFGTRLQTTVGCMLDPAYQQIGCGDGFALLGYASEAQPLAVPINPSNSQQFSGSATVRGPTGIRLATNWSQLWVAGGLQDSLVGAGVLESTATYWWSGLQADGTPVGDATCTDWSTSSGAVAGEVGYTSSTSSTWVQYAGLPCSSSGVPLVCVCLPATGSPSATPSRSPSDSPTTSRPSGAPSRTPSQAPVTGQPSGSPSVSPSASPTQSPSAAPTGSPSTSPSQSPTKSPSSNPTTHPTHQPTESPTFPAVNQKEGLAAALSEAMALVTLLGALLAGAGG